LHSLISPLKVFALELGKALGHGLAAARLELMASGRQDEMLALSFSV
jgi:hypothetical protein